MKYKELRDKVVLVTGGTQGIGEAIVEGFASEQAIVILNGRVLNEKVRKVVERNGAAAVTGSIEEPQTAKEIVKEAEAQHGRLDILVANAAGMNMAPFLEQGEKDWWQQIHINLTGHIACIQEAVRIMKQNGGGTIILISSFFGTIGWKNASGYGASKSGLLALGQYLSRAYKKENIRVCILVPGVIDTPQLNVDAEDLGISLEEVKEMYAADIAMKRVGRPSEIADMVLFMATEAGGRALNGRHVQVSGGEYRTTPCYV